MVKTRPFFKDFVRLNVFKAELLPGYQRKSMNITWQYRDFAGGYTLWKWIDLYWKDYLSHESRNC